MTIKVDLNTGVCGVVIAFNLLLLTLKLLHLTTNKNMWRIVFMVWSILARLVLMRIVVLFIAGHHDDDSAFDSNCLIYMELLPIVIVNIIIIINNVVKPLTRCFL